jgi:hypothetical protein
MLAKILETKSDGTFFEVLRRRRWVLGEGVGEWEGGGGLLGGCWKEA